MIYFKHIYNDGEQISGGKSEGDIATSCECMIKTKIKNLDNKIKESLVEDNIQIQVDKTVNNLSFSIEDSKKIINEIINLEQGLIETKNNIITSGNIGIIETEKCKVIITGILRSLEEKELQKHNRENYLISSNNDFVTVNEKMYVSSCEKTIKTLLAYLEIVIK